MSGAIVLGGNIAIAGLTATARALIGGRPPAKAFAIGALGGAAQFAGKLLVSRSNLPSGIAGIAIGAIGSSVTANAGRGMPALDELYLPIGPLRVRVKGSQVRLTFSAYDAVIVAKHLANDGLEIDWQRSAEGSTLVFVTKDKYIVVHGDTVNGVTTGSVVVVGAFAENASLTSRHELVHVQQFRFLDETLGRPFEYGLRDRVSLLRWIPSWLELGVVAPIYLTLESRLFGFQRSPVVRLMEAEAEWFERR